MADFSEVVGSPIESIDSVLSKSISNYIRAKKNEAGHCVIPKIKCKSGLSMSVQASSTHYCSPREDDADWDSVEIGYPSQRVELLKPYIDDLLDEDDDEWEYENVYGYVPIRVLEEIIRNNGGVCNEKRQD